MNTLEKGTAQRVRQSMGLMLVAKPISAIGGLLVLVLLSRHLSSTDYGVYFSIWAIVEILILTSNFGLLHAAYRYVSAIEWSDGSIHLVGPIKQLLTWRVISLLIVSSIILILPAVAERFIKSGAIETQLLPSITLITIAEGMARYLEVIFDSMLFQGSSQFTLLTRTLIRLSGLSYLMMGGPFALSAVVQIELIAATIGMSLGLGQLWRLYRKANARSNQQKVEKISAARMTRFALPAYIAQVLGVTYGPDSLKLALSSVAGASAVALFGFAYSLAAVAQRYMPANILSGIFRPIFVAMSRKPDADKLLSDLLSISIKLNWIFVLSAFCFLFFGGDPLLNQLSGGNYPTAGSVTAWLVLGLIAIAVHLNLSMYCLAMENSWPPLLATVASMVGLPLGLVLARTYGVVGVAAAFGFSELIWSVVCLLALHMGSHRLMQLDWLGFCKLICATVIALFLGTVFNYYFPTFWVLPAILTPGLFLAFVLPSGALTKQEQVWLATVLPLNKLPFFKPAR